MAAPGPIPDGICPITGHPFVPKNDYLVVAKRFGMTYKEIRARGGFAEAESTLRGRYRNLTKRSDERIRRPVWHKDDVSTLQAGHTPDRRQPNRNSLASCPSLPSRVLG